MKTKFKLRRTAFSIQTLAFSLFLCGCVTSQHLVTGKARPALAADQVELRSSVPTGAEEIGIVTAVAGGHSDTAMKTAVDALKKQAGGMGANVIVVVGTDLTKTESSSGVGYVFGSPGFVYSPSSTSRETKVQAKAFYVDATK